MKKWRLLLHVVLSKYCWCNTWLNIIRCDEYRIHVNGLILFLKVWGKRKLDYIIIITAFSFFKLFFSTPNKQEVQCFLLEATHSPSSCMLENAGVFQEFAIRFQKQANTENCKRTPPWLFLCMATGGHCWQVHMEAFIYSAVKPSGSGSPAAQPWCSTVGSHGSRSHA